METVIFDVAKLRAAIDEWFDNGPGTKRNYSTLGKKIGRSSGYIQQVCNRGTIKSGDLHKLCQVLKVDYDDLTTIEPGTDMDIMDKYFTAQGKQMAIEDYIRSLDGGKEDEKEDPIDIQNRGETSARAAFLIPSSLDNWLREKAWENRTSLSAFIRGILQEYMDNHQ